MFKWYGKPWSEVVKELGSDIYSGLSEIQVKSHRNKYGENKIIIPSVSGIIILFIKQIKQFWMLLLLFSDIMFFYTGQYLSGIMDLCVIVINALCVSVGEYEDNKNLKELQKLNTGYIRVMRNETTSNVPIEELVVGDIVLVERGQIVPADLRIVESNNLRTNEVAVTGEKFICEKYETKIEDKEIRISDMKNILFKGSKIVAGTGTGIVISTGNNTQIGSIIKLFLQENTSEESFNQRINDVLNFFSMFVVGGVLLNLVFSLLRKQDINHIIKSSAIILLNSLPQGMMVVITIISIVLLNQMKKKGIVFKNLFTIEKFSRINAVCTDKVGGFCDNKVDVDKVYVNENIMGKYDERFMNVKFENEYGSLRRILDIALLCNDTRISMGNFINPRDDLMEISLYRFGTQLRIDTIELDDKYPRVNVIPFDTDRRMMTTINKVDKNYRANIKGAVDSILSRCTHILKNGVESEITEDDINSIKDADIKMSNECLSVIGIAYRNFNYKPSLKENIESNLVFVGLIGFENAVKEDSFEGIEKSKFLNVKPIIVTEDTKLTAYAFGKKLGLISRIQQILSGIEIDNMQDDEFERIGDKIGIFSRISAKHKIKIVKILKHYGFTIAITGSKIIDLPCLKAADIGITNSKSNIIKKLSDVFASDINYKNLLDVLQDSRKIVNSVAKIIVYIMICSLSMLIFNVLMSIYNYNMPFIVEEGLWFNNAIVILSSLTLVINHKNECDACTYSTINIDIIKDKMSFIIINSILISICALVIFQLSYKHGAELAQMFSFFILNIYSVLLAYTFSNRLLFKSKCANLLLLLNAVIQGVIMVPVALLILKDEVDVRNVIIFTVIWFIITMFYKFEKYDYYDYD